MTNERLADYMDLKYPIELTPDPDGGYVAENPDLPGCVSQGESPDEAVAALEEARRLWFEVRLEDGLPIPKPTEVDDYSGRFVLRVARSVHAELARRAAREGVSLNHYVSTALTRHLGAASLQEFTVSMAHRFDDLLVDLKLAARQPWRPVTTALYHQPVSGQNTADLLATSWADVGATTYIFSSAFEEGAEASFYASPEAVKVRRFAVAPHPARERK